MAAAPTPPIVDAPLVDHPAREERAQAVQTEPDAEAPASQVQIPAGVSEPQRPEFHRDKDRPADETELEPLPPVAHGETVAAAPAPAFVDASLVDQPKGEERPQATQTEPEALQEEVVAAESPASPAPIPEVVSKPQRTVFQRDKERESREVAPSRPRHLPNPRTQRNFQDALHADDWDAERRRRHARERRIKWVKLVLMVIGAIGVIVLWLVVYMEKAR